MLHYDDSDSKESACNAGDPGLILGSGRSPGEGNDNSLQYPWLENSTDKRAWQAIVCGVAIAIMLHGGIGVEISWLNWRPFSLHNSISGLFCFFFFFILQRSSFIYLFTLKKHWLTISHVQGLYSRKYTLGSILRPCSYQGYVYSVATKL